MSAAETRKHLAYYRDNIANYEASLADTRARIAKLESKLAAEEAAEQAAAAAPRAPAIPSAVVGETWDQTKGLTHNPWDALRQSEQDRAQRFAAAIAAHVVAQGKRVWVDKHGTRITMYHSEARDAVLVYLDGEGS
jgi:hypothetical protein